MKKRLLALALLSSFATAVLADDFVDFLPAIRGKSNVLYAIDKKAIVGSDGTGYVINKNSIISNYGVNFQVVGDTVWGSNGINYQRNGNLYFSSDGKLYKKNGDRIYSSDGVTCMPHYSEPGKTFILCTSGHHNANQEGGR